MAKVNIPIERYEQLLEKEFLYNEVEKTIYDGIDKGRLNWNDKIVIDCETLDSFINLHYYNIIKSKIEELKKEKNKKEE